MLLCMQIKCILRDYVQWTALAHPFYRAQFSSLLSSGTTQMNDKPTAVKSLGHKRIRESSCRSIMLQNLQKQSSALEIDPGREGFKLENIGEFYIWATDQGIVYDAIVSCIPNRSRLGKCQQNMNRVLTWLYYIHGNPTITV